MRLNPLAEPAFIAHSSATDPPFWLGMPDDHRWNPGSTTEDKPNQNSMITRLDSAIIDFCLLLDGALNDFLKIASRAEALEFFYIPLPPHKCVG